MKRILTAGILSIGIHALILGTSFNRLYKLPHQKPAPKVMFITLTTKQHEKPVFKPVEKKPTVTKNKVVSKVLPTKKTKKRLKPKPKPQKTFKIERQPAETKKKPSQNIPEKSFIEPKLPVEAKKTVLKESSQNGKSLPVQEIVRKAKPLYKSNPPPVYPRIARVRGYKGEVLLDVLVDKTGKVSELKVFQSSGHPILDRAAKSSVKTWVFTPGMIGTKKVKMWVRIPIRFRLK